MVTITGTNLETVAGAVLFHGVNAPFEVVSKTKLLVTQVPPGATSGALELFYYQFGANSSVIAGSKLRRHCVDYDNEVG